MVSIAKVGDQGFGKCTCHDPDEDFTTTFTFGAETVLINGAPAMIVGGIGASTCGHSTKALTGTPLVLIEGQPAHRCDGEDDGAIDPASCGPYTTLPCTNTVETS